MYMKILRDNRSVIQSDYKFEDTKFAIRSADSAIIMEMLRSKIYSNKPAAVVREYTTNALDEHKKHGIKRNVEITVPTHSSPEFKVRDFGIGLSHDEIVEIYVNYGCSTKRDTDDLTGGLGIGCKAGFSYGSQFTITSIVKEGDVNVKRTYFAVIDEGHDGVLKANPNAEVVDEPTGIEIGVGVQASDLTAFNKEIWNLVMTSKQTIVVHGWSSEQDSENFAPVELTLEDKIGGKEYRRIDSSATSFKYNNKYNRAVAIMGNIGYPINHQLLLNCSSQVREMLKDNCLHIDFDIGELSISTNREELEYNTATVQNIESRCVDVLEHMTKKIVSTVMEQEHWEDQQKVYSKSIHNLDHYLRLAISEQLPGEITSSHLSLPKGKQGIHYHWKDHGGSQKLFKEETAWIRWTPNRWSRGHEMVFAFCPLDMPKAQMTRRIKTLLLTRQDKGQDTEVLVLYKMPSTSIDDARKDYDLPNISDSYVVDINDYEPLKVDRVVTSGKTTTHVELFKWNANNRYIMETETWIEAGDVSIASNKGVLYMHLSGIKALRPEFATKNKTGGELKRSDVNDVIKHVQQYKQYLTPKEKKLIGHYFDKDFTHLELLKVPLYGVRKKHYNKIDSIPNAINLFDLAKTLVDRHLDKRTNELLNTLILHGDLNGSVKFKDSNNKTHDVRWCASGYDYHSSSSRFNDLIREGYVLSDLNLDNAKRLISSSKVKLLKDLALISSIMTNNIPDVISDARFYCLSDKLLTPVKDGGRYFKNGEVYKILLKVHETWPMLNDMIRSFNQRFNEKCTPNNQDRIAFNLDFLIHSDGDDLKNQQRRKFIDDMHKSIADDMLNYLSS